ncbi:hypothetical protein [Aeromonas sobria]|nr:hypothetical protein [Aeromonas sobria]
MAQHIARIAVKATDPATLYSACNQFEQNIAQRWAAAVALLG